MVNYLDLSCLAFERQLLYLFYGTCNYSYIVQKPVNIIHLCFTLFMYCTSEFTIILLINVAAERVNEVEKAVVVCVWGMVEKLFAVGGIG